MLISLLVRVFGHCAHKAAALYGLEYAQNTNDRATYDNIQRLRDRHPSFFNVVVEERETKKRRKRKSKEKGKRSKRKQKSDEEAEVESSCQNEHVDEPVMVDDESESVMEVPQVRVDGLSVYKQFLAAETGEIEGRRASKKSRKLVGYA